MMFYRKFTDILLSKNEKVRRLIKSPLILFVMLILLVLIIVSFDEVNDVKIPTETNSNTYPLPSPTLNHNSVLE